MSERFDVVIVGSGFGGAVSACRLAEAGARVLILERGRRWTKETYPRALHDPWLFDSHRPEKRNGWLDLRFFGGMAVAQGAGVGGGSLCYSSVVMEADPERFESGWPEEISYAELQPYYAKARAMLRPGPLPAEQLTHRHQLLRRAADKLGYADRFERVPLAISFDPEYSYALPNPIDTARSKSFVNPQGIGQGTCVHLGNCDIGCDVHAKNTLDLNYLAVAERHGASIRPLHLVRYVERAGTGYRVVWDQIGEGGLIAGSAQADRVVLSAGSLGSTEILLRSRDEQRSLPDVSPALGVGWSANANFLATCPYPKDVKVEQGIGPTISSGLDFLDGSVAGQRFFVEDDGFPNVLLNAIRGRVQAGGAGLSGRLLNRHLRGFGEKNPAEQIMVWLGEGIDASNGRIVLERPALRPWRKRQLKVRWDLKESRSVIEAIIATHRRLAKVDNGRYQLPPLWRLFKSLITVHPLGGCAMGSDRQHGVVDHRGQVFGYPNLFVADGSVLPRPTGRNPSMTIAALSERIARQMM